MPFLTQLILDNPGLPRLAYRMDTFGIMLQAWSSNVRSSSSDDTDYTAWKHPPGVCLSTERLPSWPTRV